MIGWAAVTGGVDLAAGAAVRDHLLLDAAAFLGAGALRAGDYARGRRADAAGRGGRRRDPAADADLYPGAGAAGAAPWACSASPGRSMAPARARARPAVPGAARRRSLRASRDRRAPKRMFAFSILYLFLLFAALLAGPRLGLPGCWGVPGAGCSGEPVMTSPRRPRPPDATPRRGARRRARATSALLVVLLALVGFSSHRWSSLRVRMRRG